MTTRTTIIRERLTIVRESTDDEPSPVADEFANLPALFERRRQPKRIASRRVLLLAAPRKEVA